MTISLLSQMKGHSYSRHAFVNFAPGNSIAILENSKELIFEDPLLGLFCKELPNERIPKAFILHSKKHLTRRTNMKGHDIPLMAHDRKAVPGLNHIHADTLVPKKRRNDNGLIKAIGQIVQGFCNEVLYGICEQKQQRRP